MQTPTLRFLRHARELERESLGLIFQGLWRRDEPVEAHAPWPPARRDALERVRWLSPHSDLPAVLDVVEEGDWTFVVREPAYGPGVGPLLGARSGWSAVEAMIDVARAIGHAHRQGVGDGQLRPEAILATPGARPRVMLGAGSEWAWLTARRDCVSGQTVDAPHTISPQRLLREPTTPIADDVWALGAILYMALTRKCPFGNRHLQERFRAVIQDRPSPPSAHEPTIPRSLDVVTLRALERDPALRYPDADALADALATALPRATPAAGRSAPA